MPRNVLLALVFLLELSQHVLADPKVVSLRTRRKSQPRPRSRVTRRDLPSFPLQNQRSLYMYEINVTVGSPPQDITLDIDTGSSDLWVFSHAAYQLCNGLCQGGSFLSKNSSTYSPANEPEFNITYQDGSAVTGNYFTDTLSLGKTTVKGMTMALATTLDDWHLKSPSIMGIGLESLENVAGKAPLYPGITRLMVEQGLINTRSYSLYLDEKNASTGTLLFGGYDTTKFVSPLSLLPIQPSPQGSINAFLIPWTSLSLSVHASSTYAPATSGPQLITPKDFSAPALLDSGTSLTYIPRSLYEDVARHFVTTNGASTSGSVSGSNLVSCSQPGNNTLIFGFRDPNRSDAAETRISIPFSELAPPAYDNDGRPVILGDGSHACVFGLYPSANENEVILGDTFLRSAYVLYDLDSNQIGLAQADWKGAEEGGIVELETGTTELIPEAGGGIGPGTVTVTPAGATVTGSAGTPIATVGGFVGTAAPGSPSAGQTADGGSMLPPGAAAATGQPAAGGVGRLSVPSGVTYVVCAGMGMFVLGALQVVFM